MFEISVNTDYEWRTHALCYVNKIDPRVFDGVKKSKYGSVDYSAAKEICASCPVKGFCLEDAVENDEIECVRGGLSPSEYQILKSDPRKRQASLKRPGAPSIRAPRSRTRTAA